MKKVSVTVRIPIFVDLDVELEDQDFDTMLNEWEHSNFGLVRNLISEYVDLDSVDLINAQERYGDTEIVDVRLIEQEEEPKPQLQPEQEEDHIPYTTITPRGKPN
jgi:hypothetical protein